MTNLSRHAVWLLRWVQGGTIPLLFGLAATVIGGAPPQTTHASYDVAFNATRDGHKGIFVMHGDGSAVRLVVEEANPIILGPWSWSPSGDRIAYFCGQNEILTKYGRTLSFHFPLYVVNVDGSGRTRLLDISVAEYAWSPDSTRLAFTSGFEDPNMVQKPGSDDAVSLAVYVVSLKERIVRRLTPFDRNGNPSWLPDGRRLAFSNRGEVYVVDPDGANARQLTKTGGHAGGCRWSPRGDWIAFSEWQPDHGGLFVIRPDGSGLRQLRATESTGLTWSPDGASILVLRPDPTLVDLGKGTLTSLPLDSRAMDPVFSPDGRLLLYRADRGRVYAFDLQSREQRTLIELVGGWSFSVSPLLRRPPRP